MRACLTEVNVQSSVGPNLSLQMQSKMMAYDRVITDLNAARLRGISYPVVHAFIDASIATASDVRLCLTTYVREWTI
jgi:nuclear pore complex protein Nup93